MLKARGSHASGSAMLLAGLALGAYVFAAWPDTTHRPTAAVRRGDAADGRPRGPRPTASVARGHAESELSGVLGELYPLELFFYEVSPAPLLDALIAAPQPADAN